MWNEERDGRVVVATYADPPMSYFTDAAVEELAELISGWGASDAAAVVITGGTPGRFITHFNVDQILQNQEAPGPIFDAPRRSRRVQAVSLVLIRIVDQHFVLQFSDYYSVFTGYRYLLFVHSDVHFRPGIAQRGSAGIIACMSFATGSLILACICREACRQRCLRSRAARSYLILIVGSPNRIQVRRTSSSLIADFACLIASPKPERGYSAPLAGA